MSVDDRTESNIPWKRIACIILAIIILGQQVLLAFTLVKIYAIDEEKTILENNMVGLKGFIPDEITKVKGEVADLRSELNTTRRQITTLEKELNLIREKLSETKNTQNCTGSSLMLEYDSKHFLGIITGGGSINYATAERLCIEIGSHPANIYSRNHSIAVHGYIRKLMSGKWTDGSLIMGVWLGMTYNPSTDETRNYDGSVSTVDFQWDGHPESNLAKTQLSMRVYRNSRAGGIINLKPSIRRAAVLCETN